MSKLGVLLINLGTPDQPTPNAVFRYLTQFLNDPRVIDLPQPLRALLVNGYIIPKRFKKTAAAYQTIWGSEGSPLLVNSLVLKDALSVTLGDAYHVELGMRYGNPSIASALKKLEHCKRLCIIPLFPQYASAANGSAIAECLHRLSQGWNIPEVHILSEFHQQPAFIRAYAEVIQHTIANQPVDQVLFSYHGLPERHIHKSACQAPCAMQEACPQITDENAYCYRAQCYETTRLIAAHLKLELTQYQVSFQSRLGRTPWIKPYTDLVLPELIKQNKKNIAVVCPSFVSDCLETLEEINIRGRQQWQDLGGEGFVFVPCINAHPVWVQGLANMTRSLLAIT